jgi:hypothetical protein
MANLLNLGGLLTVGVGTSSNWENGLIDLNIPGLIDVAVLPGTNTVGELLGDGLLGQDSGLGQLLGPVNNGLGDLLSGVGSGVDDIGSGLGDALSGIGQGLGGLLGGGTATPGEPGTPGTPGTPGANGPGVVVIQVPGGISATGTSGNDFLLGGVGNDKLFGGGGNDILDGASGFDIAIYQGNHTDYTLSATSGTMTVVDAVAGRDGTDTLRNMEFLQFKDGGVDIATNTFVSQDILNKSALAYRAVVRTEAPAGVAETVGVGLAQDKFTFGNYIDALIQDVEQSTIPALLIPGVISGEIPTSEKLDALTVAAQQQYDYYKNVLGSASAELGPYEALGRGFASTSEFQAKYAAGTDATFITSAYIEVFGASANAAQQASLQSQIDYFESLYQGAGLSAAQASLQARGAVFGQIVGYAAADRDGAYHDRAEVLLTGFANGDTAGYGAAFGV